MNTTQLELQNRIKLLMEYDMKHTLSENHEMILEIGIPGWVGTLSKNVLDDVISNSGGVLKTLGGKTVSTSDDLLKVLRRSGKNSLDDLSRELLRNSLLKNASVPIKQKGNLIKDLITNQVTINKYANNTNQQIFKKFQKAGYPDDVSQTIANKLKPAKTTPKPNITNPSVNPGVLSDEAQGLFGKMGRKITPEQAAFLDDASKKIYGGIQKLSPQELLKLTDDLENLGIQIQSVITKLNNSKNLVSQQKAKILQKGLDDFMTSLSIITKSGGKINVWELAKLSAKAVGILAIIGALNWFRKTQLGQVIQSNLPNPFSTETTTPEVTQPETAPETTPTKEKLVW
jgi:hypothetical protein